MYKSPFACSVRCTAGYPTYPSGNPHHGEDYVPTNKSIESNWNLYAVTGGTVIRSNNNDDYGNCVVIAADNGYWVLYAHMKVRNVKIGQQVAAGEKIGVAGWTGHVIPSGAAGRHLHIEVSDMRAFQPKWNYKEHCEHRLKPSDYIDFGNKPDPKEDFKVATWKNGSTVEPVYQTTADCKAQKNHIGSLAPRENCECYGIVDGCYLVVYTVNGTNAKKTGFVRYHGGVKV